MAWKFYDANGVESIAQIGTVAITAGGTGAITAALAATALGVGATSTPTFATITATGAYTGGGLMTTGGNIVIPNAGNIGSVGDTNAITISSGGVIAVTATTASSSATTGAFTVAGGAGIVADLSVGDDVRLISDSAVLSFGADSDTTLTHTDGVGLGLNGTNKITFNDVSQFIQGSSATVLSLGATAEIDLTATLIDINGNADISGTTTLNGIAYTWPGSDTAGSLRSDGSGALTWTAVSAGVGLGMVIALGG